MELAMQVPFLFKEYRIKKFSILNNNIISDKIMLEIIWKLDYEEVKNDRN